MGYRFIIFSKIGPEVQATLTQIYQYSSLHNDTFIFLKTSISA